MPHSYALGARVDQMGDEELISLMSTLEAASRNTRVQENPESLAAVGARMREVLGEIEARVNQAQLF